MKTNKTSNQAAIKNSTKIKPQNQTLIRKMINAPSAKGSPLSVTSPGGLPIPKTSGQKK
jgi:hypothetical protein